MDDERLEYRFEVVEVHAEGQAGGFGQVLLVERRRETCYRPVAVLGSRDAEFLAAAHNACVGLSVRELRELADNGGVEKVRQAETLPEPRGECVHDGVGGPCYPCPNCDEWKRQAWAQAAADVAADRQRWQEYFEDDGAHSYTECAKLEVTP